MIIFLQKPFIMLSCLSVRTRLSWSPGCQFTDDMVITLITILALLGLCQGRTPPQCQLRLSCELTKFLAENQSEGDGGLNCEDLTDPGQCRPVTHRELQEAALYLGGDRRRRGPRSVLGQPLPPVITIAGQRPQCRQCEVGGSLCLLFGIGKWNIVEININFNRY